MNKENVAYIHNRVLFKHKEKWNYAVCKKMGGTRDIMLSEISQPQKTNITSSLICII
jgi:hypothetical protein